MVLPSSPIPPILQDRLDAVHLNPTASHSWHHLIALIRKPELAAWGPAVIQAVAALDIKTPSAEDFLRATFLATATGNREYTAHASRLLAELKPVFPDRLAAFLGLEWGRTLKATSTRDEFIRNLQKIGFPHITRLLDQEIALRHGSSWQTRDVKDIRRVAIIAPHIGGEFHTPTCMALEQARILLAQGVEVKIYSAQELMLRDMSYLYGDGSVLLLAQPAQDALKRIAPPGLEISFSGQKYTLAARYGRLLDKLRQWDPDLIYLVGLYSPLASLLHAWRPTIGLSVNSVPPLSRIDVWLSSDKGLDQQWVEQWPKEVPPCLASYHPFRVSGSKRSKPCTRGELGIPDGAQVLITVGFRLADEIHGEWARRMVAFLGQRPQVVWVLLGGKGKRPPALEGLSAAQLLLVPTRNDVDAVLQQCDIFVNPPRMGGGFSVAEAMTAGLPVLTHGGSDGGDKLGNGAVASDEEYFAELAALLDDDAYRRAKGAAMKQSFASRLDLAASGPSLLRAGRAALENFRQRRIKAAS